MNISNLVQGCRIGADPPTHHQPNQSKLIQSNLTQLDNPLSPRNNEPEEEGPSVSPETLRRPSVCQTSLKYGAREANAEDREARELI